MCPYLGSWLGQVVQAGTVSVVFSLVSHRSCARRSRSLASGGCCKQGSPLKELRGKEKSPGGRPGERCSASHTLQIASRRALARHSTATAPAPHPEPEPRHTRTAETPPSKASERARPTARQWRGGGDPNGPRFAETARGREDESAGPTTPPARASTSFRSRARPLTSCRYSLPDLADKQGRSPGSTPAPLRGGCSEPMMAHALGLLVVASAYAFTLDKSVDCYASRYPDLHARFCANGRCHTSALHDHYMKLGYAEKRLWGCHSTIGTELQRKVDHINTMKVDFINSCQVNTTHTLSSTFVPIFVMSRDRVSSLRQSLGSYKETIQSPYEIVILDHNSTYVPMIDYLYELKTKQNITVVPLQQTSWDLALKEARGIIRRYLNHHPNIRYYAFTDPDIAFLRTLPDVLLFYAGLLHSCPKIKSVGPGLQISDIPAHFTKTVFGGKSVYRQHSQFWTTVPNIATWNGVGYHIAKHPIDTTFAMFRRDTDFGRLVGPSFRAYAPYAAVHVDWYDDSKNLPADKVYYKKRQSGNVNNWRSR